MREPKVMVVLLLTPPLVWAATARRVEVSARIPVVAQVETPGVIELRPGETREVTVRVACNQGWLLRWRTDHPQISAAGRRHGAAGGMTATGNTFAVTLVCAPEADGPQRTVLSTALFCSPVVAGRGN